MLMLFWLNPISMQDIVRILLPMYFQRHYAAAKRAIRLDSTVALGWAALSHYHTYFGRDWAMAEYAFERANELNPNLAYNHYHRSWYLVSIWQDE